MIVNERAYLDHHGVKGQKWGIRNRREKKPSRKSQRQTQRQARYDSDVAKANHLLETALKDPQVLIKLNRRHIVTGEEFVQHLSRGGLLDVPGSSIYAQQKNKKGPYVLQ